MENNSILGPEVRTDSRGRESARPNVDLDDEILGFDGLAAAGEAKSHRVAWSFEDLLGETRRRDFILAARVYSLEDCTARVAAGGVDFTAEAECAVGRAGMRGVRSTNPVTARPDLVGRPRR
jgi:nicotinamidase-related amidase